MKKTLTAVVLISILTHPFVWADGSVADETTSYAISPAEVAITAQDLNRSTSGGFAEVINEEESAFSKASLPMKAAIIVGAPIVAAGFVVTAIVLTPVWLVKKILE